MKLHYNYLLVAVFLLFGCATLDTYNKRVAAFEISYNETLRTAKLWQTDPDVSLQVKESIKNAIQNVEKARFAIKLAETSGDLTQASNQLKLAQSALNILREIVKEQQ